MRNINELVGIIYGVNFDGVINAKEVSRLQSWVDKNRNLIYEPKQLELIKLVDQVLEDHIITEIEKEELLAFCSEFQKGLSDETVKIYELNGIVEGIICDGEINEKEIIRLKEWMSCNGDLVREHNPSKELCNLIDEILEDGIVTVAEQDQLLQFLAGRISGSHFQIKLDHLKKQVKARKVIGIDLIDLLDDLDAIEEIHRQAESQLKRALRSYASGYMADQEIVFISLVLIGMLHYDGNFYDNVRDTYSELYGLYSEQKIEGFIRSILGKYRPKDEERTNRSRIINVVLSNAIVPSHFLGSFFEFIFDIYKLNFDYDLSDNLAEDFLFVYEGLRNNMLSDDDNVNVNVTRKSYKLIKSTKRLIVSERNIDAVIKLSIIVAKLIDKQMWNKEFKIFNPYLKRGYSEWIATLNKDEQDTSRKKRVSEFRSRWEPKYMLQSNQIYLVPPVHRVKAQYNYYDICIVLKNGDNEIYRNNCPDIREIIGGYQISPERIPIENPIGNIIYQLLAGDEIIYDSKQKLFRDFIVFNQDGHEIANNTDYTGTAIFCMPAYDRTFKSYLKTNFFLLAAENVHVGDAVFVRDTVFNFSAMIKPGVLGEEWDKHSIIERESSAKHAVFRNAKYLVYEAAKDITRFEIILDTVRKKVDDFQYTMTERDGINKYILEIPQLEDGMHSLEVNTWNRGRRERILPLYQFGIDSRLNAEVIKVDDDQYLVEITSGIIPCVTKELVVSEYNEDFLHFDWSGKEYIYRIPLSLSIYRIDNNSWTPVGTDIWIGDVKHDSVLDIYGHAISDFTIYGSDGRRIDESISISDNGVYQRISIGFLNSYKTTQEYVILAYKDSEKKSSAIFCYNKCVWNEELSEIKYDAIQQCLDILPSFYGKGNVFLRILDSQQEEIYKSSVLENNVWDIGYPIKSFEKYQIQFFEKEKGLRLKKERLLKQYDVTFFARKDLVGRSFKILDAQYDQQVSGEWVRKTHSLNRVFVDFTKQISEELFEGDLYARRFNGSYWYHNLNPVEIEICGDVMDGTLEISITKDGDGLFLDFEHHAIINKLYDDTAIDIFSYTIEMKGEETF